MLSETHRGVARMGYGWCELTPSFQYAVLANVMRLSPALNAMDVGTLLWSLGELDANVEILPDYVVLALFACAAKSVGCQRLRARDLSRTITGLSRLGLAWDKLPANLQW